MAKTKHNNRCCNVSANRQYYDEMDGKDVSEVDYDAYMLSRAKCKVLDIGLNNSFSWFVTFTFDKEKIDRENLVLVKKRFLKAVNNYGREFGSKIEYVAVPERHNVNSNSIHFHCLLNGLDTKSDFVFHHFDKKTGHKVFQSKYFFNKFGAVYGVRIFDYNKFVSFYVTKYITKGSYKIFPYHYFRSQGLNSSSIVKAGSCNFSRFDELFDFPSYVNDFACVFEFDDIDTFNFIKGNNVVNGYNKKLCDTVSIESFM